MKYAVYVNDPRLATYLGSSVKYDYRRRDIWGSELCARKRWDLFQILIPQDYWIYLVSTAMGCGMTELLEYTYGAYPDSVDIDHISDVLSDYRNYHVPIDIIPTLEWAEQKWPGKLNHVLWASMGLWTPEIITWFFCNYACEFFQLDLYSDLSIFIKQTVNEYGIMSVEAQNWVRCVAKIRELTGL